MACQMIRKKRRNTWPCSASRCRRLQHRERLAAAPAARTPCRPPRSPRPAGAAPATRSARSSSDDPFDFRQQRTQFHGRHRFGRGFGDAQPLREGDGENRCGCRAWPSASYSRVRAMSASTPARSRPDAGARFSTSRAGRRSVGRQLQRALGRPQIGRAGLQRHQHEARRPRMASLASVSICGGLSTISTS